METIKSEPRTSTVVSLVSTSSGSQNSQVKPQLQPSRFTNGTEYEKFFSNLINLESNFLKNDKSNAHVWMSTSYDRQTSAVQKFASESSNDENLLYQKILGTYVEKAVPSVFEWDDLKLHSACNLPPLNINQETIVKKAIRRDLTLIFGTTGSGKTVTLLSILYNLVQDNRGPILICGHTNTVVDHLASTIHKMNVKIVRLFAETVPSDSMRTHDLSLENQIRNFVLTRSTKLEKSCDENEKGAEKLLHASDSREMTPERHILDNAEVICCTCIGAGDKRLSQMKFHAILIDESMQCTEPESIISISLACDRLVLIGDWVGLTPIVKSKKALDGGLKRSLLQRLVDTGLEPLNLLIQARMHPFLWFLPSFHYLECFLPSVNGVSADERKLPKQAVLWPKPDIPMMVCDVRGSEIRSLVGPYSYCNKAEVLKIHKLVTRMLKQGISPDRIGIITQYVAQKDHLLQYLEKYGPRYREIRVDMVDAFQGQEKDVIIISTVRSHGTTGLGSFGYKERFHLALTRAKFGLIIVGNSVALLECCKLHGIWIRTK